MRRYYYYFFFCLNNWEISESLVEEPNINKPSDANKAFIGVFQSSFGEFELIYSDHIYGIQTENEFNDM